VGTDSYDLTEYEAVRVFGGGNAAACVTSGIEDVLGDRLSDGVVVTDNQVQTDKTEVLAADHPVPKQRGMEATHTLLTRAEAVGEGTLVLAVITGGGSSCLVAPCAGISLSDLQTATEELLKSGASIHEINTVRKHLSDIKGGQFASTLAPARVVALVLSDVVGNDLDVIASGPLEPDDSTYVEALRIVNEYDLNIPATVRGHLQRGAKGEIKETPTASNSIFDSVTTYLIGTNMTALKAAAREAKDRGYTPLILSSQVEGEARDAARLHVAIAKEIVASGNPVSRPAAILSGGETTVAVEGNGQGGPNQEFALTAAPELPSEAVLAAVDTDGIDGNTEVAGALVGKSLVENENLVMKALAANDAGSYLSAQNALIRTGPTGTNVNDLRVMVVGSSESA